MWKKCTGSRAYQTMVEPLFPWVELPGWLGVGALEDPSPVNWGGWEKSVWLQRGICSRTATGRWYNIQVWIYKKSNREALYSLIGTLEYVYNRQMGFSAPNLESWIKSPTHKLTAPHDFHVGRKELLWHTACHSLYSNGDGFAARICVRHNDPTSFLD
jgi:hypothetical protein